MSDKAMCGTCGNSCDSGLDQHDRDSKELRMLCAARDAIKLERDQLRAELAAIKAQEPVEYQQLSKYGNWDRIDKGVFDLAVTSGPTMRLRALYAAPVAKQVVMPVLPPRITGEWGDAYRRGWNAYEREFARLNAADQEGGV